MAGLGRRTFAAGEVLTASNVMNYLQDQAVMNFAGTAARGSAIGTAVVSEGMTTYLADSNMIETYDGTSWERQSGGIVPIAPSSVSIASGSGSANAVGLVSFTSATSVSLNNVFSSAYSNYRIFFSATNFSATSPVRFRYRATTDNSTSNYYMGGISARTSGAIAGYVASIANGGYLFEASIGQNFGHSVMDISAPQKAVRTTSTFSSLGISLDVTNYTGAILFDTTAQFDGITIFMGSGNMSGTIQVFGYND